MTGPPGALECACPHCSGEPAGALECAGSLRPGESSGAPGADGLPDEAYVAALAGLPHLTPSRLSGLVQGRSPSQSWGLVRAGKSFTPAHVGVGSDELGQPPASNRWSPADLARAWRAHAVGTDPATTLAAYQTAGVSIWARGSPGYPASLCEDPEAPAVLFSLGSTAAMDYPRVALIGTRNATHYGEEVAGELGAGLTRAGVSVVSGLALGIDGAAHRGALAASGAPPLAVVGSGLDVVYPPRHARLWSQVAAVGGILSESPLGTPPEAWRFPWRNRLIAALSDVVVVVESHAAGGALLTVNAALRRGVSVMAVPGSVRSPASAGTNALIADGCAPARDTEDILVALGLSGSGGATPALGPSHERGQQGSAAGCSAVETEVWKALEDQPTPTDVVLRRTGLSLGEVASALDHLEQAGWARAGDGWWERANG